jgi:hypothetical protein
MNEGEANMSAGDIVVYAIAVAAFVFLGLLALAHWKDILRGLGLLTVGVTAIIGGVLALGVALSIGITAWEYVSDRQTMQECLTAYERQAKSYAAPDDYFGEQLRAAAVEEKRKCAEFAVRKQAAERSSK